MKIHRYLFSFLIAILLFSSCSTLKVLHLLKSGNIAGDAYRYEVPFEYLDGEIFVTVVIDGKKHRFFFDTGAINIISKKKADSLKLENLADLIIEDVNGGMDTIHMTKIEDLSIEDAVFTDQGFGIYNFTALNEMKCFNIDGILGANLMHNSIWQIDIKKKILVITSSLDSLQVEDIDIRVPFTTAIGSSPKVKIKINNNLFDDVTFDYGSNSGIDLVSENIKKDTLNIDSHIGKTFGTTMIGIQGEGTDTLYAFVSDSLRFGNSSIDNEVITYRTQGTSTIGTEFLQHYIVTIDWDRSMIYMKRNPLDSLLEEYYTESFGVVARLIDDELQVCGIKEGSSAFEQGIVLGDRILSINGRDYSHPSLEEYCDILYSGLFPEDLKEVVFIYERDGQQHQITLESRKLL